MSKRPPNSPINIRNRRGLVVTGLKRMRANLEVPLSNVGAGECALLELEMMRPVQSEQDFMTLLHRWCDLVLAEMRT